MLAQTALSCKPHYLPCCPYLDSSAQCYPSIRMQDDITGNEVIEAAIAFAATLLVQLLYACWEPLESSFSMDKDKQTRTPRPDWIQLSCSVVFGIMGSALAAAFITVRARHLPHARELFLAWKGVSLLASRIFEVFKSSSIDKGSLWVRNA
ncbi:hypothetical protein B0T26DRAFT_732189, partial [Lasiosphaeria miniovina]